MSVSAILPRLVTESDDDKTGATAPRVFTRLISIPPGPPWDQARAAALEARVGAPLPYVEISCRLLRLEPWRPSATARFAALYVRSQELRGRTEVAADVEGRRVSAVFLSGRERERRARRVAHVGLATGVAALLVGLGATTALSAREQGERRLRALEETVVAARSDMEKQARLQAEARALDQEGVSGRRLTDLLTDLAWASNARSQDARIQAVHWSRGYLAVEVRGEAAPFVGGGRSVQKIDQPLRKGVWLWGVAEEMRR